MRIVGRGRRRLSLLSNLEKANGTGFDQSRAATQLCRRVVMVGLRAMYGVMARPKYDKPSDWAGVHSLASSSKMDGPGNYNWRLARIARLDLVARWSRVLGEPHGSFWASHLVRHERGKCGSNHVAYHRGKRNLRSRTGIPIVN